MIKYASIIFLFILIFLSCEERIDWHISSSGEKQLVVETILTDEFKNQQIKLSNILQDLNEEAPAISNAEIYIESDDQNYLFTESASENGIYSSLEKFSVEHFKTYRLNIKWESENFEASEAAIPVSPLRNFTFSKFNNTDSLYLPNIGVEYNEYEQAMYLFDIDWSHLQAGEKTKIKLAHYIFNSINMGQLFGPQREVLPFPRGSQVIIRKYALSDEYAEYLRSLVIETQFMGGFFEESSAQVIGNISNGAYGYFALCSVRSDTLIAE